ncbi:DUF202 domain-containing protein [Streptomyces sp. NPDC059740]|uniref:DUF202 domain-containing protein n=1 Tax=Streptomyces sp. NPDC059740 TaxID=3346926 RepID=UPI00365082F5
MTQPSSAGGGAPVRDPGLQPERTRLAWRRTTLSAAVAAVLAGRQVLHDGLSPGTVLAVALVALAWVGFTVAAHLRLRAVSCSPRPAIMSHGVALTAAGCVLALAALGTVIVFL